MYLALTHQHGFVPPDTDRFGHQHVPWQPFAFLTQFHSTPHCMVLFHVACESLLCINDTGSNFKRGALAHVFNATLIHMLHCMDVSMLNRCCYLLIYYLHVGDSK